MRTSQFKSRHQPHIRQKTKSRTSELKMKSNSRTRKKDKINKELYRAHLKVAQEWRNLWYLILESVQESINTEMDKKYKNIYQKLDRLQRTQTPSLPPKPNINFHSRIINQTNITVSSEELNPYRTNVENMVSS